jgi:ATP-dependent DNA helicase DinG
LEARVLLPHEFLGRFYFPSLATATCLSATTWIKGGFDAAKAYTGLERAVTPMEDEERLPCSLRTFRAPEVFDYSRVLVAVPRDAPAASGNKDTFLAFVRDFLVKLCERTGGRTLVLFTNADDVKRVGARLEGHFRARKMPFWYQNMEGSSKEKLSELFRNQRDSILMGVDTFWYGADFPGETLEYLVMVRLPYGVPDRYHYAQCAALGSTEQRRQIYMPKALAKFRQGFGRLMRRVSDHGCVFMLDQRVLEPRHRVFLKELPIQSETDADSNLARLVRGNTDYCLQQAMEHMGLDKSAAKQT